MIFFKGNTIILTFYFNILFFPLSSIYGQSLNIEFGQTTASYAHKTKLPKVNFFPATGQVLRMSYAEEFLVNHELNIGIALEEANSLGSVVDTELEYSTRFLGLFGKVDLNIINVINRKYCSSCTDIQLFTTLGGQISTLASGTQKTNEVTYNLKGIEDFKGFWLTPVVGAKVKFDARDFISVYGLYEFMPMFNVSGNEERFRINQNILVFGIRLWL